MLLNYFSLLRFLIYVALPIFLLIKIWRNTTTDLVKWILSTISNAGYILCLFVIGGWPMVITGYYMRYFLLLALFIAVIKSFTNQKRQYQSITKQSVAYVLASGMSCLIPMAIIFAALSGTSCIPEAIELDFPLKNGDYYVLQGGSSIFLNHHVEVDAQRYALDIIKLDRFGFRCKSLNGKHLTCYRIYGDQIHSPVDGRVIEIVDHFPDLEPFKMDPDNPAGNYLAIEMESSPFTIVLAHVQKSSFLIEKGERVQKGQPLCRVGNSGNTSEPHLHIHAVKSGEDLLFEGAGIPMKFNHRFLVRNNRVSSAAEN